MYFSRPPSDVVRVNWDSPQAKNLIGWWPVTHGDGATLLNAVTGDKHMTHTGFSAADIGYSMDGSRWVDYNGTTDYYTTTHASYSKYNIVGDITISFRMRLDTSANLVIPFNWSFNDSPEAQVTNTTWEAYISGSNQLYWFAESGTGATAQNVNSNVTLTDNVDIIVTIRRDSLANTIDFIISEFDSVPRTYSEVLGSAYTTEANGGGSAQLYIGTASAGVFPFNGKIWDCRIYDAAIPLAQMRHIHNPHTQYDLYMPDTTVRRTIVPVAAGFSPYWASGSNVLISNGIAL